MRNLSAVGMVVVLVFSVVTGVGLAQAPTPVRRGTLRVALSRDWKTLEPARYTNVSERMIFYALYNPLVSMDENFAIKPELARSWTLSKDGLEWTFRLAQGVRFHDGTPFNAQAVKFNLDRILNPENASTLRGLLEPVKDVQAVDDLTVKIVLKRPFTPLLALLTEGPGFIASPTAVQRWGRDYGQHPVGTGPFQLVEWTAGDQVRLKRFDGYWEKELPYLDEVVIKPVPDETVRLANLRAGAVDVIDSLGPRDMRAVTDAKELKTIIFPGTRWPMTRLSGCRPPFNNKALRQAVSYAVNRDQLIQAVYFGQARPAYGPISPVYRTLYNPQIRSLGYSSNLEKARQKLSEGGQPNGFRFALEIASDPTQIRMAELIKAHLAEAGIIADIQAYESTTFQDRLTGKRYEAAIGSWTPRPDPDGTMFNHFHSQGNVNHFCYSNPKVDQLLERERTLAPGEERTEVFREAERLIVGDAPWVFLLYENIMVVMNRRVNGLPAIPDTMLRFKTVSLSR